MPWWTCFNCTNVRPQNNCNDVFVLDFAHHSLHDVPADVFQYERTLEELYLTSNRITELPRQLFYCHELKILYLNDNDLTQIPAAISSLVNLRKINLARNSLSRLTDSLTACRSLTYLDLSVNNLEKLPDAITNLLSLEELYLNDTFLEYLPTNVGNLINLRILELRDNNLMTLPKSMNQLQHLRRLDIGNNEFTELPEVIGSLIELTELWCDENRIEQFNCNVANLKELIHFDATNNLLKYLPNEIGNWQKCQELIMSTNELEELPFSIGMMKSLRKLKVDENQLQALPDSICEMENLEEIMISHNDLFKLPTTIGLLRRLRFLTADENLLRVLPNEICSCSSLTILSVRGNKLTKIPIDIGRLIQLRVLNIVNNFLSNLPVTILNLTQLSALWISDNQSQPLMPLQKEFHKETQSYYLTCYLLPQQPYATADSSPTNIASTPTTIQKSQSPSIYSDAMPAMPSRHYPAYNNYDDTPRNTHMTALDNMSLTAISTNRPNSNTNMAVVSKRRICFAADAPQDQPAPLDQSRLMRSPTPYPRELRMMANRFANRNHHQQQSHPQHQLQQYTQQKNLTNNLDEVDNLNQQFNAKLIKNQLNQSNSEVLTENNLNHHQHHQHQQKQQSNTQYMNDFDQKKMNGLDDVVSLGNVRPTFNGNMEMNHLTNGIINGDSSNHSPMYNNEPQAAILNPHQGIVQLQQQQQQPQPQLQYQTAINQSQSNRNGYDVSTNMPIQPAHPLNTHIPARNYHHNDQIAINKDQLVLYESFSEVKNRQRLNAAATTAIENGHNHHIGTPPQPQPPPSSSSSSSLQTNSIPSNQKPINEIQPNFDRMYSTPPNNHDNNSFDYENGYDNKPDNGLPSPSTLSINDYYNQNAIGDIIIQQNQIPKQSDQQQQPPPYHIAKAFTKKSKQDLLIYDIHRQQTNHQSTQDLSQQNVLTPTITTMMADISNNTQLHVDYENNETPNANINEANNHYRSNSGRSINNNSKSTINNSTSNWVFGEHKNPTVMQLSVPKVNSDIGFKIIEHSNQGIFISEVASESNAAAHIKIKDKILDVDGVDFSKISLLDAQTVLSNAGPIMNIMISRGK